MFQWSKRCAVKSVFDVIPCRMEVRRTSLVNNLLVFERLKFYRSICNISVIAIPWPSVSEKCLISSWPWPYIFHFSTPIKGRKQAPSASAYWRTNHVDCRTKKKIPLQKVIHSHSILTCSTCLDVKVKREKHNSFQYRISIQYLSHFPIQVESLSLWRPPRRREAILTKYAIVDLHRCAFTENFFLMQANKFFRKISLSRRSNRRKPRSLRKWLPRLLARDLLVSAHTLCLGNIWFC